MCHLNVIEKPESLLLERDWVFNSCLIRNKDPTVIFEVSNIGGRIDTCLPCTMGHWSQVKFRPSTTKSFRGGRIAIVFHCRVHQHLPSALGFAGWDTEFYRDSNDNVDVYRRTVRSRVETWKKRNPRRLRSRTFSSAWTADAARRRRRKHVSGSVTRERNVLSARNHLCYTAVLYRRRVRNYSSCRRRRRRTMRETTKFCFSLLGPFEHLVVGARSRSPCCHNKL